MTIQEKKNYLKQYKKLIQKINVLEKELHDINLSSLPGGIDYSKDKIQTTPTNDQMINYVIKLEDLENSILSLRMEAINVCNNILETISTLEDETYQAILHRRYILFESWEQISFEMNYSTQRLYELHGEALADMNIRENQS